MTTSSRKMATVEDSCPSPKLPHSFFNDIQPISDWAWKQPVAWPSICSMSSGQLQQRSLFNPFLAVLQPMYNYHVALGPVTGELILLMTRRLKGQVRPLPGWGHSPPPKPDSLSLLPGTHTVEGENRFLQVVLPSGNEHLPFYMFKLM